MLNSKDSYLFYNCMFVCLYLEVSYIKLEKKNACVFNNNTCDLVTDYCDLIDRTKVTDRRIKIDLYLVPMSIFAKFRFWENGVISTFSKSTSLPQIQLNRGKLNMYLHIINFTMNSLNNLIEFCFVLQ